MQADREPARIIHTEEWLQVIGKSGDRALNVIRKHKGC